MQFDWTTFLIFWGVVTAFAGVYVIPIMLCAYVGVFLIGYARAGGFHDDGAADEGDDD